jgi:hypothetical protein
LKWPQKSVKSPKAIFHPKNNSVLGICDIVRLINPWRFDMALGFGEHPIVFKVAKGESQGEFVKGAGYGKIKLEQKWASKAARRYAPISKGAAVAGTQTDAAFR